MSEIAAKLTVRQKEHEEGVQGDFKEQCIKEYARGGFLTIDKDSGY